MNIEEPNESYRIALWHLGFRPFFLAAAVWALVAMLLWMGLYRFGWSLPLAGWSPMLWHGHEMVFGYALAVIAGFLLTAVKNWTGVQTLHGVALALLLAAWLAARVAPLLPGLPLLAVALPDLLFGGALVAALAWPVVKARQWKQLIILSIVATLVVLDALFYARAAGLLAGDAQWPLLAAVWLIVLLITIMASRVVPMFMQNGIGGGVQVTRYRWVERSAVPLVFAVLLMQLFAPGHVLLPWLAGVAVLVHTLRLYGWYLHGMWSRPLVWVLYVGYGWLVIGLGLLAVSGWFGAAAMVALHALVVGVLGTITVGMMSRVSIGHTGRMVLSPPRGLAVVFVLLTLAAMARVLLPLLALSHYADWVLVAQWLWIAAFALFLYYFVPMLLRPRVDGRYG